MIKNQEEIEECAKILFKLRQESSKSKSKEAIKKYTDYHNFCCNEKFKCLINIRVNKYKKFSNYQDLQQEGYLGLMRAMKTFKPSKGSFTYWADRYISTKISRAANAHSTIKIPLKKCKEFKPFKMNSIPVMTDHALNGLEILEEKEFIKMISKIVSELPEQHQLLINLFYGFQGMKTHSITDVAEVVGLNSSECSKVLRNFKKIIKNRLELLNGRFK